VIFVTVGTSTFPFDRLMRCVDQLGVSDELVVQYGASAFVPNARVRQQFMSYADVLDHMQHAHAVVAHGGVGSILTALHAGKHPIVVPRRRQFAEAVDDHQLDLATQLAQRGVVTLVGDLSELGSRIADAPEAPASAAASSSLAEAISEFVDSVLGLAAR
jgi:UDP-N-acetylglucosamine transferase subunit ALG13